MPITLPDIATTSAGTPVAIAVLANDTGQELSLIAVTQASHGNVSLDADQSLTYTPDADFVGSDSFTYTIRDAADATAEGVVHVEVTAANDPPVARPDTVLLDAGEEALVPVLANDDDPDGDPLELVALSMPAYGVVNVRADRQLHYIPQPGFAGIDSLTYTIADTHGRRSQTTVTFHVEAFNAPPVAVDDRVAVLMDEPTTIAVTANDDDPEGGPLRLVAFTTPSAGTLGLDAVQNFVYTPNPGYLGADSFTYTVRDAAGASAAARVAIEVTRLNQPPEARTDSVETEAGVPVTIVPLANDDDPDGDPVRLTALSLPAHGTLDFVEGGGIVYTPANDFVGSDQFGYNIDDGRGGTDAGTVAISVLGPSGGQSHANGFAWRRDLVVGGGVVAGGTHQGFPLWLDLAGDWLRSAAHGGEVVSDDGFDIRFELEGGTVLAHEIAAYDPAAGRLRAWVRLPELAAGRANVVAMFYGKAGMSESAADPAALWQDYLAVYHLPGGVDVSPAGRNATSIGTLIDETDGLGGSVRLAGDGLLRIDDADWLDGLEALTVQLRCRADDVHHEHGLVHVGAFGSDADSLLAIRYDETGFGSGGPTDVVHAKLRTQDGNIGVASAAGTQTTGWQSLALAWQSGDDLATLFVDGDGSQASYANTNEQAVTTTAITGPLHIGAGPKDDATGGWIGLIDEVRFRAERLSDGWIATEAANQNEPAAFFGVGDATTGLGGERSVVALPQQLTLESGDHDDIDVVALAWRPENAGPVTIEAIDQPAEGVASVIDGVIRYTAAAGFVGRESFGYSLRNGERVSRSTIRAEVRAPAEVSVPTSTRTVAVDNSAGLRAALADARPGDEILLASGVYSGSFATARGGTSIAPVVIRASSKLGARFTGSIDIDHVHVWLWGLVFDNATLEVRGSNVKALRCKWRNLSRGRYGISHIDGTGLEVAYCEFFNIGGRAIDGQPRNGARKGHIHHCHFHKWPNYQTRAEAGRFAGRYGASDFESDIDSGVVLEDNLFDNAAAGGVWPNEWVFEFKCSGNIIRRNTVRHVGASRGTLGVRHGENNLVQSNRYVGSGSGLYVTDWNNRLIGNDVAVCNHGIRVFAGQIDPTVRPYRGGGGLYPYAKDTLVAWNKGSVIVGYQYSDIQNDPDLKPARGTRIEAHEGRVIKRSYGAAAAHAGTVQRTGSSEADPGAAPLLDETDVGPDA